VIEILNNIISGLGSAITGIVSLLPQSPFNFIYEIDNSMIQYINFLFPFASAVTHLTLYLSAVLLYYAVRIALKWIKAAGN
jgi:hypothetical protein